MTAQIMGTMSANEVAWTKAAAAALLAIRNATHTRPDVDQIRDINTLADALHNIGMVGTHSTMFEMLHPADDLAHVEAITSRLLNSFHRNATAAPSPTV